MKKLHVYRQFRGMHYWSRTTTIEVAKEETAEQAVSRTVLPTKLDEVVLGQWEPDGQIMAFHLTTRATTLRKENLCFGPS